MKRDFFFEAVGVGHEVWGNGSSKLAIFDFFRLSVARCHGHERTTDYTSLCYELNLSESCLARRERFYAGLSTVTIRSGTVDLHAVANNVAGQESASTIA